MSSLGKQCLAALLLEAAEVLERMDKDGHSSDDYIVPRHPPPGTSRSRWPRYRAEPVSADEYDEDIDDAPPLSRRKRHNKATSRRSGRGSMQHNEVEKRRRAYLAACYVDLKAMLPGAVSSKASNVSILRSAVEKIQGLEANSRQLDQELVSVTNRQKQLLVACAAHQKRHMSAGFVTLVEATASSSDDSSAEMEVPDVPDAASRSLSPETGDEMTYDYAASPVVGKYHHMVKLGSYPHQQQSRDGGGAIRRRQTTRPARFNYVL